MPQHFRIHDGAYPHFITSSVVYWIPVFSRDDYFRVLVDNLVYCVSNKGLLVHAYVVMPNHFHAICSHAGNDLSSVMRDLKKYTARIVVQKLESEGRNTWLTAMRRASGHESGTRVWDESFHPEQVHSEPFFQQKLDYLHNNPVRAGYVNDPCEWKYSSAAFYYRNDQTAVPIEPILW